MTVAEETGQLDIVEVVERYGVRLVRHGRYWWGRCPFHPDTGKPNFAVEPSAQAWICFVCGGSGLDPAKPGSPQWGDVIGFVSRIERLNRREAVNRADVLANNDFAEGLAPLQIRHNVYGALLRAVELTPTIKCPVCWVMT